ncbi:MAG: 50S ribosomal protein L24 [Pirellulaceae bacterium]|jgi:large subunit ribosomal protein L24|nr:50S ribosomal protein L24 [Pirellulaceae bacterium]
MLIREQDEVLVISGANKGKRGKVLKVLKPEPDADRQSGRVVVEGINQAYKHVKRSSKNPQGGRLSKEMAIDISNVALLCPKTGKPTRIGVRYLKDGSKERFAKRSGASLGGLAPANPKYAHQ